ncbi:ATP-binding protein [Adlercreutzia sp. ZJ154]|uniref:ATP-binding protein n=1 Tax=Adlercreutzia sp. ZJ154 TaxID=2709790 RepID=UPI0013EC2E73|nr:ATP-binding protein [Adlercreutzia sp. ZJ154]
MAALENPFTPTFGEIPAHLAGRRFIIQNIGKALNSSRRRPELTTIFSGARGTGKTTLLALIAEQAEQLGWITASVTAMPGMLEDIEIRVRKSAAHLLKTSANTRISSIGIPQVLDIEFNASEDQPNNWRSRMDDILASLEAQDSGLLITVDEVDVSLDEMVQLAAIYQHFVREGKKVALIMAGLPNNISALTSDKTVSFLRRAEMVHLGRIDNYEIEDALRKTISEGGRNASSTDIQQAAEAIDGFPFMLQLVGFRSWEEHPDNNSISSEDFENGIKIAREEMRARIFESTYRELSEADISFLNAMLPDNGDSKIADIQERLEWSSSQTAQYRRRLIDAGIIGERRRGVIAFDMPFFREFLQEE